MYQHKRKDHEGIKDSICDLCGKGFSDKHRLKYHHENVHSNRNRHMCEKCGAEYSSKSSLEGHKKKEHPTYAICTFCQNLFNSDRRLKHHLLKEHKIKTEVKHPYFCWKCSQNLFSLKDLDEHLVNEHSFKSDEAPCQLCEKAFCSQITLKAHVVDKHDLKKLKSSNSEFASQLFDIVKIKPKYGGEFECNFCGTRFSQKRSLSVHIKQYHDKSNHIKCKYCDYSSFQPYMVRKHEELRHTKANFLQCDLCKFKCREPAPLKTHKERVHEGVKQQFPCQECDQKFTKRDRLIQHLFEVHNIISQIAS